MNLQDAMRDLQGLDGKNPGAWPLWVRISSVILLSVLLIGFGIYFFLLPEWEVLESEKATEVTLKQEFETKQRKVAALDAYKEQLKEMERTFGAMLRQLPGRAEVANLVSDISQTRASASLDEQLFEPTEEVPREFYAEVPNKIEVLGQYHQMGEFVSAVAALPRIVTIDEVEVKPVGGTAPKDRLVMAALAKTYRYLDDSEIAAQAEKEKAKAKQAGGGQ